MRHPQNCSPGRPDSRDFGQALGLVLIAVVLIASVAVAMAAVAARMADRSAAQSAADAAALAGAVSGRAAAAVVAEHNGGQLIAFELHRDGADVTVSVRVEIDGESASARASTAP